MKTKGRAIDTMTRSLPPKTSDRQRLHVDLPIPNGDAMGDAYCAVLVIYIAYDGGRTLETWLLGERRQDDVVDHPWDITTKDGLRKTDIAIRPYGHRSYE